MRRGSVKADRGPGPATDAAGPSGTITRWMGKDEITIGAAVPYARTMPVLTAAFPALRAYLTRLGSRQIRTLGTIGGNIGTASPIGDMPPVLLALETRLRLVSPRGARNK